MLYEVYNQNTNKVVARANTGIVFATIHDHKPVAIPEAFLELTRQAQPSINQMMVKL